MAGAQSHTEGGAVIGPAEKTCYLRGNVITGTVGSIHHRFDAHAGNKTLFIQRLGSLNVNGRTNTTSGDVSFTSFVNIYTANTFCGEVCEVKRTRVTATTVKGTASRHGTAVQCPHVVTGAKTTHSNL